jgi:DNA transformation protein
VAIRPALSGITAIVSSSRRYTSSLSRIRIHMREPAVFYAEIFAEFGAVQVRRMFGGLGIYHQGIMFALDFEDVLYLKTDADTASSFLLRGLEPFTYTRAGRTIALSYHRAPDDILDDPEEAALWARRALASARLAGANPPGKSRRRTRKT